MNKNLNEPINFFIFKTCEQIYALYLSNVSEVIRYKNIFNLPGSPSYVKGVVVERGIVIPLISLKDFLKLNTNNEKLLLNKDLVVCTHKDIHMAIMVDKIYGLRSIDIESCIDHENTNEYFITGFKTNLDNETKRVGLLDLDQLIPAMSKM